MSNSVLKVRHFPGQTIAYSLFLALLSTLGTTAVAQQLSTPPVKQSQPPATTTSAKPRLVGKWVGKDPSSGETLTLIFTPESKLFFVVEMLLPEPSGSFMAVPFGYRINSTPQPMHLDATLLGMNPNGTSNKVMTIFEFTDEGKLRLQIAGINPGEPRPTAFTSQASLFEKISNATTLPPKAEIINFPTENQPSTASEAEGKMYIGTMNRAQQAYYLESKKFATTIDQLALGLTPDTNNYRYRIVRQRQGTRSAITTAQAKLSGRKSYTGAVFVVNINRQKTITIAGICETDKPSTKPPAIPKPPKNSSGQIQCAAGSHRI